MWISRPEKTLKRLHKMPHYHRFALPFCQPFRRFLYSFFRFSPFLHSGLFAGNKRNGATATIGRSVRSRLKITMATAAEFHLEQMIHFPLFPAMWRWVFIFSFAQNKNFLNRSTLFLWRYTPSNSTSPSPKSMTNKLPHALLFFLLQQSQGKTSLREFFAPERGEEERRLLLNGAFLS